MAIAFENSKLGCHLPALLYWILTAVMILKRKRLAKLPTMQDPYKQRFFGDPAHVCFGCSPFNAKGLHIDFFKTDIGGLACQWSPDQDLVSFVNIVHGGLSSTLLDELGGVVIQYELDRLALTISGRIHYHSPAFVGRQILAHARILARLGRYVLVGAVSYNDNGKILASMTGLYYIPSKSTLLHLTKMQNLSEAVESYLDD